MKIECYNTQTNTCRNLLCASLSINVMVKIVTCTITLSYTLQNRFIYIIIPALICFKRSLLYLYYQQHECLMIVYIINVLILQSRSSGELLLKYTNIFVSRAQTISPRTHSTLSFSSLRHHYSILHFNTIFNALLFTRYIVEECIEDSYYLIRYTSNVNRHNKH